MGGGNAAILAALTALNLQPDLFIANDSDHENRQLLSQGKLDFVLYHDLSADINNFFNTLLHFIGLDRLGLRGVQLMCKLLHRPIVLSIEMQHPCADW